MTCRMWVWIVQQWWSHDRRVENKVVAQSMNCMSEQSLSGAGVLQDSWRDGDGLPFLLESLRNGSFHSSSRRVKLASKSAASKQNAKFLSSVSFHVSCHQKTWTRLRVDFSESKNLI